MFLTSALQTKQVDLFCAKQLEVVKGEITNIARPTKINLEKVKKTTKGKLKVDIKNKFNSVQLKNNLS